MLVKQLCEKLDVIRAVAGEIFMALVRATPAIEGIADRPFIENVLPKGRLVNWSMAHETFPLVIQVNDILFMICTSTYL